MVTKTCPSPAALHRLAQGIVPPGEAEQLEQHLLQCATCFSIASSNPVDDPLVATLRTQGPAIATDSDLTNVLEKGHQLGAQIETLQPDLTLELDREKPDSTLASQPAPRRVDVRFLAPPQSPEELGRLGEYRILKVLGVGGMGIVFEAEDIRLKRRVALKAMKPEVAATSKSRERFLREAQCTAAIDHDHIVPIYQVGEERGVPFIAMQFLRGMSLKKRLEQSGALPAPEVVRIGREIASGLAAAHEQG